MPGKCDICEKAVQFGHNVSHSKRRTNRMWRANTNKVTVMANGAMRRMNLCTRCLRSYYKSGRV